MPILYSVISRSTTVLAKYAECVGNFAEVSEQIMGKIGKDNHKQTYTHGSYLINYIAQDNVIYMCITDDVSIIAHIIKILLNCNMLLFLSCIREHLYYFIFNK